MKSTRVLGAIAAGSLLLTACSGGSATDSATEIAAEPATEVPAAEVPAAEATGDAAGDDAISDSDTAAAPAALQFSAPLVGGGELDATTLAGKPTVFWFWAPT
ncbi:MAG: hypothetical protein HOJ85_15875 [Ilumatobacter sp.]|uniref:hypothetical protein n=1 Tax=Ilumatobacter sp. TaxID=1967498 RepID=UPI00374FEE58|nr:hypothetical protein [Ilumatobacter sp.]MBT5555225.1 hypothetical protein [Ilumatobacter sp.]